MTLLQLYSFTVELLYFLCCREISTGVTNNINESFVILTCRELEMTVISNTCLLTISSQNDCCERALLAKSSADIPI